MPQFDVSSFSSQLFWLVIVFGFLYFLISRIIAPKAESIIAQRDGFLEETISYAEEYNNKAKSISKDREAKLREVNSHVEDLHKQAIELMESQFAHQKQELSAVLDKKREKSLVEIQNYIDKFRADGADSCVKLAAFIIHKITNKEADVALLKKIQVEIK